MIQCISFYIILFIKNPCNQKFLHPTQEKLLYKRYYTNRSIFLAYILHPRELRIDKRPRACVVTRTIRARYLMSTCVCSLPRVREDCIRTRSSSLWRRVCVLIRVSESLPRCTWTWGYSLATPASPLVHIFEESLRKYKYNEHADIRLTILFLSAIHHRYFFW